MVFMGILSLVGLFKAKTFAGDLPANVVECRSFFVNAFGRAFSVKNAS
jgi:hypothetical protein